MQVDLGGAIRIACLAEDFDWRWSAEDLQLFCDIAGWQSEPFGRISATLRTNLEVPHPVARAYRDPELFEDEGFPEQEITHLLVLVADGPDDADAVPQAALTDAFAELADGLADRLGQPTRRFPGDTPMISWERPGVVLVLRTETETERVRLDIVNPVYQSTLNELRLGSDGASETRADLEPAGPTIRPLQRDWHGFCAALASTLARLPSGGRLLLGLPEGRGVLFSMGRFELRCQIYLGTDRIAAKTVVAQHQAGMAEQGWASLSGKSWSRSIRWPSIYEEHERLADVATTALRQVLQVATPHELEVSAWLESLESSSAVPDTSAFRAIRPS